MRSMTGYGLGEAPLGQARVSVEVRSLNHRYLDVRLRTSSELVEYAFFLEQRCRSLLTRGRYDVSARFQDTAAQPLQLDAPRIRQLYATLEQLNRELSPDSRVSVSSLLAVPGIFTPPPRIDEGRAQQALEAALTAALSDLDKMRSEEGRVLHSEIQMRLESARSLRDRIAAQGPALLDHYRSRMRERLERLLADTGAQVDPGRIEAELALLADRIDVTEELVRLGSHFEQFAALLAGSEPSGRRLDFLLQEIGRETNTIGSKCQDASLSHLVVDLKSEIERMREQVQNVE